MLGKICKFIIMLLLLVQLSGCTTILVGTAPPGGYVWWKGALIKEFEIPAQKLHRATRRALKSLNFEIHKDESDRISSYICSRFSDGKKIRINIDAITEKSSCLIIRVGWFGDKINSEIIYNHIKDNIL